VEDLHSLLDKNKIIMDTPPANESALIGGLVSDWEASAVLLDLSILLHFVCHH